jgi:AcrR family transcriptional regulator
MVEASGVEALTMERLAARAGVSKALTYGHFQNTADVLVALLQEEWDWVDGEIARRLATAESFDEKLVGTTLPFLDGLSLRGPIFPLLVIRHWSAEPLSGMRRRRAQETVDYWSNLVVTDLGIDPTEATRATIEMVFGALETALRMLWRERCDRDVLESAYMGLVRSSIRSLKHRLPPEAPKQAFASPQPNTSVPEHSSGT